MKSKSHVKDLKLASFSSVVIGIILLIFKFYAYHITNSQAIFSDALESIINVVAGIITFIVIIVALRPADKDHPYGHGKIESMASTFEGGAILLAGILVIIQAVQSFFHGSQIQEIDSGILVVVGAGVVNGLLGVFLYLRGKKYYSEALKSSGLHLLSDTLTSVGLFVGLLLVKFTGLQWIDPAVAVIFGGMLSVTGAKILLRSGSILVDAEDTETLKLLVDLFEKHYLPGVIQIHFTRVIRSGSHHHIDCHMVIPEFWSVKEAHDFSEQFEKKIIEDYPVEGELHIHHDPCRMKYCASCELANCPIRREAFVKREPFEFEEITAPMKSITSG
ncbi:MAG: cation diffusion facilitator family transporter [Bacteriovoracaceae bacterium]|nr:cation diffusion facilitator family transporter [Bacteriovoracaceae bacterium]